jgi:lysophospholipase L1-like esterase
MARARRGERGALVLLAVAVAFLLATVVSSLSSAAQSAALAVAAARERSAGAPAEQAPPPRGAYAWRRPTVLAVGDSITEYALLEGGWWRAFAGAYARRADVVNRGLSGYNSRWALLAADESAGAFGGRLAAVVVWLGANDAKAPLDGDERGGARLRAAGATDLHVPLDEYGRNLKAIAQKLRDAYAEAAASSASSWALGVVAAGGQGGRRRRRAVAGRWPLPPADVGPVIVFVTPAPLHEQQWLERLQAQAEAAGLPPPTVSDRLNSVLALYADEARAAAASMPPGTAVVADVRAALEREGAGDGTEAARAFFSDGLHLSQKGNEVALREILRALDGTAAAPSALPYHLPTYGQVACADPQGTFGPLEERGWGGP